MPDDEAPDGSQRTLAHPDHVETVDVVAGRLRAERARAGEVTPPPTPTEPAAPALGDSGARVGRYQLLELVGTGGMGLVWGAWDPELERRVALKLVRLTSHESRDRMLREGQVLARLSHPNVVPIFDVGAVGDQVFLVMEWVRGTTLRAYAGQGPGLRALLDAYRQAGAGLEGAHATGVIHRDFKPDNAIRGDDGRVRVLDFGLAHDAEREPGASHGAGTPRYMAPEQARGEVTPAVDQFAFCVALREALERAGAVPAWVAAIIERGTRAAPAERFPSMAALLAALARDPVRARRRAGVAAVAAAVAVGAFAFGRSRAPVAAARCSAGSAELAETWTPEVRARIADRLRLIAPIAATELDGTTRRLDAYADGWFAAQHATCEAAERGALTPPLHDARQACLRRARARLAGVIDLFDRATTLDELAAAQQAAGALPAVRDCALAGPVAPPPPEVAGKVKAIAERVERGWVLATAGRPEAVEHARAVTADAASTGYQPLLARALLVEGWAAVLADQPHGRDALDRAWQLALAAFDEPLMVEAYARWVYAGVRIDAPTPPAASPAEVIARSLEDGAPAGALEQWPMVRGIADRLGDEGRFARALLYNNVALPLIVAGDKAHARALLRLAQQSAGDAPAIELVAILENLARLETDPADCERQLRAALARHEAALGPTHPNTLAALRNVALVIRERRAARATFEIACRGLHEHQQIGGTQRCAYEAAWVADEDGDRAAARAHMTSAAGLSDIRGRIAAAFVEVADGAPRPDTLAALERYASEDHPRWLERLNAADALVVLALAARDPTSSDRAWQRALSMLDTVDYVHFSRRKAHVRAIVAERLAPSNPTRAASLATLALTWYRGVPGDEALAARLEKIATPAHAPRP